ncbi:MAG TPA: hypothetical protein VN132_03925, partial [Bdellovibrio sp.]|nr:hypothetical protein [Bdellovibrio sp.]
TTQAFGQNATIARQPQADIKPSNLSNNCPSGPAGFDCRVAAIPSNSNSIYSACKANVDKVEELYKQPAFQHYMRPEGNALLVVRREQFKMILNTEINYASRIPSDSPVFETAWQDLRNRWESRVEENPEVLAVDQDSVVAPDRCGLHMLLGLSCDDHPGVDIIGAKKSEAIEQHQGESRGHGYSWSFTHKLLKYELMKMISEANWGNDVDLEKAPSELKYLLQEEKKLPINTVYRDFPELAISNHLSHYLMQLARSTGLSNKLSQEIGNLQEQKKAQKQHLSFYEKSLLIEKAMEQTFSKQTIPKQTQQYVENMFYDTYSELLKSFEEHIQKAKNDPDWAFSQDYLLGTYMSLAQARNDKFSAGVMQTIV